MEVIPMKTKNSPTSQLIALIAIFTALAITVIALPTGAQEVITVPDVERHYIDTAHGIIGVLAPEYTVIGETWAMHLEDPQEPPEIRIMNRIIRTSLEEVKAPELPEELTENPLSNFAFNSRLGPERRDLAYNYRVGVPGSQRSITLFSGSQKVTGFYMEGYGYLFTVRWPIRSSNLFSTFSIGGLENLTISLQAQNKAIEELLIQRTERSSQRSAGRTEAARPTEEMEREAEVELTAREREQEVEMLRQKLEAWQAEFENLIVDALKNVMATYGHTLHQAADDEKITFVFQQSDEETENLTLSVERGNLSGPDQKDAALRAITVTRGSAESNPALKSQIRIMSEIIDAAFEEESGAGGYLGIVSFNRAYYYGGEARTQYIPGYGVIFTKSARMNIVTVLEVADIPEPDAPAAARSRSGVELRSARDLYQRVLTMTGEEASEASREKLHEHFDNLKHKTAEILATYGSALTELNADEWVGINYEVGSSAGLLQAGVSNYMVLARMSDVLQALRQSDGAQWLLERLVTNEKLEN